MTCDSPLNVTRRQPRNYVEMPVSTHPDTSPRGNPINSPDNEDKFATLFSPATPRGSPTSSPRIHSVRNLPHPPQSLLRSEVPSSSDSVTGLLVPVSPAADPLSLSSNGSTVFDSLTSQGGTGSAENESQRQTADQTSSLKFFDSFTKEAKRAFESNRRGYLDELLLHEDDPLYWVKEEPCSTVENADNGNDDFGDFASGSEDRRHFNDDTSNKETPVQAQVDSTDHSHHDIDDNFSNNEVGADDGDDVQDDSPSSVQTRVAENVLPLQQQQQRIPSPLPQIQSLPPPATNFPSRAVSNLSLSSPSNLDHPSQTPPRLSDLSTHLSTTPGQDYRTLSTFSSRWMSSLLSSSRISAPSTSPSAHSTLDTFFASHASPVPELQNVRQTAAVAIPPTLSRHTSHSQTMSIPRKQHSDSVPVSISHSTPFASHIPFIPPSGAPGFSGESHSWDRGFSKDYDKEKVERRSVLLKERKEDEGCVGVLGVVLADMIRPHLPALARLPHSWTLLYSLDQHGVSLKTLYNKSENQRTKPGAIHGALVAIKDSGNTIFGAWIGEGIRQSRGAYYGGGDAFLWKFISGQLKVYKWTGKNDYVSLCEPDFISFGGGDGRYGLYLDDSLSEGSSAQCPTFDNDPLCSLGPKKGGAVTFECVGLEVWTIGI